MSTFLGNFFRADTAAMDPLFYSAANGGIPSESKLATYMLAGCGDDPSSLNRHNVVTPTYGLSTGLSRLSLDSPISVKKAQVPSQSPEFIPHINSSPNCYSPYHPPIINNGNVITPPSVKSTTNITTTPILGGQQAAATTTIPSGLIGLNGIGTSSSSTYSSVTTPIKGRSNSIQNESPQSVGDTSSSAINTPQTSPTPTTIPLGVHQENVGGTIYFYPTANHTSSQTSSVGSESVPQTTTSNMLYNSMGHVYPGPASNVINMKPKTLLSSAFFMPEEMRTEIQSRNDISNLILENTENSNLPIEADNYHSLYPLEPETLHPKLILPSSTYKATNSSTGIKYCLRRLHGFRLQSTKCMTVVEMWKKLQHSNVVQLREVFTTKAFGDNSLVLVYDYHPGSQTLLAKYFTPSSDSNGYTDPFPGEARPFSHKSNLQRTANGSLLPETTIWSIIMQLTSGLRAIHQAGLSCRALDPTKIIVTGKRIRFSFPGISDIVSYDPNTAVVNHYQQEDLTSLGKLVLALACRCLHSVHRDNVQTSIELVSRQYSSDLRNLIIYLLSSSTRRSVTDLMPMIGARFYTQLDALQSQCDMQEDELAKEMENGRLYRLLVKLGCINERPDFNMDTTWSETGDRYMLKLFRDYLFHSVTEDGRPWLDQAHIVQCLNKLDAGIMEKVQLMSRDEQSVLIVTYAELKNCLENAFSELVAHAAS